MDHLEPIPLWTLVANIKHEISYGEEKMENRKGTKQFSPGTKVYIIDWFAGMCKDIIGNVKIHLSTTIVGK